MPARPATFADKPLASEGSGVLVNPLDGRAQLCGDCLVGHGYIACGLDRFRDMPPTPDRSSRTLASWSALIASVSVIEAERTPD
jgi:hypothetical protein